MRRYMSTSSALWWVTNGRATAPPGMTCIIGVSTSMKSSASRKLRRNCTMRLRERNTCAAVVVDDQVHVALAVAALDVGEPVPLVGQRTQRLDEQPQALDPHRELAGPRLEKRAFGAEDVADVPALEVLVGRAERVVLQEHLHEPGAVLELGETRLAHDALEHHPPGDGHDRRDWPRTTPAGGRRSRRAAPRRSSRDGNRSETRCRARAAARAWRAARRSGG